MPRPSYFVRPGHARRTRRAEVKEGHVSDEGRRGEWVGRATEGERRPLMKAVERFDPERPLRDTADPLFLSAALRGEGRRSSHDRRSDDQSSGLPSRR